MISRLLICRRNYAAGAGLHQTYGDVAEFESVDPIFRAFTGPLKDLGVDILSPRSVSSTDHGSFENVGLPGFQFVQERYEYNSRTHHSNMDVVDRVQPDDMKLMNKIIRVKS